MLSFPTQIDKWTLQFHSFYKKTDPQLFQIFQVSSSFSNEWFLKCLTNLLGVWVKSSKRHSFGFQFLSYYLFHSVNGKNSWGFSSERRRACQRGQFHVTFWSLAKNKRKVHPLIFEAQRQVSCFPLLLDLRRVRRALKREISDEGDGLVV